MSVKHDEMTHAGHGPAAILAIAAAVSATVAAIEKKRDIFSLPSTLDTEIAELKRIEAHVSKLAAAMQVPAPKPKTSKTTRGAGGKLAGKTEPESPKK